MLHHQGQVLARRAMDAGVGSLGAARRSLERALAVRERVLASTRRRVGSRDGGARGGGLLGGGLARLARGGASPPPPPSRSNVRVPGALVGSGSRSPVAARDSVRAPRPRRRGLRGDARARASRS